MQFLNNDMDELMRRAADGYETNVTGADWDKVEKNLTDDNGSPWAVWMNSGRRFVLLFTFLLASLVCNRYLHFKFGTPLQLSRTAVLPNEPIEENLAIAKGKSNISKNNFSTNDLIATKDKNVSKPFYEHESTSKIGDLVEPFTTNEYGKNVGNETAISITKTNGFNQSGMGSGLLAHNLQWEQPVLKSSPIKIEHTTKALENKQTELPTKRLYVGVIGGLDASTVKFSEVKWGFSGGLIAGYNFSKKWSIESGVIWNKKSYYADGKDFNPKKVYLPSHSNILYADGYCQMFEIPMQVQYRFKEGKKHNWFASAGASSYMMQKEEYDYLYERYNVQYYSNKYYKTASKHLLATVNVSAGYQYKMGRSSLRVEPYVKLPVRKMGVGSLPITSAGLQLGLTYPLR